jgi:hypothetical protein
MPKEKSKALSTGYARLEVMELVVEELRQRMEEQG